MFGPSLYSVRRVVQYVPAGQARVARQVGVGMATALKLVSEVYFIESMRFKSVQTE